MKSNGTAEEDSSFPGMAYSDRRLHRHLPAHLGRPSVLPAGGDVSDDAGVALLAHIDAVHLDDALAWVQPRHGRHGAWGGDGNKQREAGGHDSRGDRGGGGADLPKYP